MNRRIVMKKEYAAPELELAAISASDILLGSFDRDPYVQDLSSWAIGS